MMTPTKGKIKMKTRLIRVIQLSVPAIMAQISSIIMQYIDAGMVGSLGADATASIGLVSSTTWLINGIGMACAAGFAVQVAQYVGAGNDEKARSTMRQSLLLCTLVSAILSVAAVLISPRLPHWLNGTEAVCVLATQYFFVYGCSLFFVLNRMLASNMLQCAGDMKTPSLLNILLCALDVVFNSFFIFYLDLGVLGAALGTACSEIVISAAMFYKMAFSSPILTLKKTGSWKWKAETLKSAFAIGAPIALEHTVLNTAQIMIVGIIAPLGTVAVAANSLAVTAESLCYMPGYGIGSAATTLVGQSVGAKDMDAVRSYANLSVFLGVAIMSVSALAMYMAAPLLFDTMTSDGQVRALGTMVLRIEAFAEPFFAASIVIAGALRGAKDTLVPSLINLATMWGIRITLSMALAPVYGLPGVWFAMAFELFARGCLFFYRLFSMRWLRMERSVEKMEKSCEIR